MARESFYQIKQKPVLDERQFNNFYITRHELDHTPNLGHYSPRNSNIALNHITGEFQSTQISITTPIKNTNRFISITKPHPASSILKSKTITRVDTSLIPKGKRIYQTLISILNMSQRALALPILTKLAKY